MKAIPIFAAMMMVVMLACNQNDDVTPTTTTTGTSTLPDVYKAFSSSLQVYVEGNSVVIKSTGVPDHKSPYFGTGNANYEAYNGTNTKFNLNPNRIGTQAYTFKIPLSPAKASTSQATPLGPIGVSLNGVPFYNQYAAQRAPLTDEINSFDQYNGHPDPSGSYHYHIEPLYLTKTKGKSALLGFLLDGFPVYGPEENGKKVTNSDLDAYHGHTHATTEYPNGIYHYHITTEDPYLNGTGFYGTAGTITR
jgi:hypothetical protein